MKHILFIFYLILFSLPSFGQPSDRPQSIVIPISSIGEVSESRKQILQNTLTQELSKHYQILPQDQFERVQEKVFEELDYEECTEDQCIVRIQEVLQIENVFNLQIIGEEGDTQLNLKWMNLDEKKNREDYCEGCKTKELRKRVRKLVKELIGKKETEKSKGGVLYIREEKGELGWFQIKENETDGKFLGDIRNGIPNGEGTITFISGIKYVGEWENGDFNGKGKYFYPGGRTFDGEWNKGRKNGQGIETYPDGGKWIGEWKDGKLWKVEFYDKYGNIQSKYVNGIKQ